MTSDERRALMINARQYGKSAMMAASIKAHVNGVPFEVAAVKVPINPQERLRREHELGS